MKKRKIEYIVCGLCLGILICFMCTIFLRACTRQILVKRMGIRNWFTDMVFFDSHGLNDAEEAHTERRGINWAALFPFPDETQTTHKKEENENIGIVQNVNILADSVKNKVRVYSSDLLMGYQKMAELSMIYNELIQWDFSAYNYHGGILELKDGFFITPKNSVRAELHEPADSTTELAEFCEERDIDFVFVLAPSKVCKYKDVGVTDVVDFSNQDADRFLDLLGEGVDALDVRELIHEEGLDHHELFYKTDHHWKSETGLWAAQHILKHFNEKYKYDMDLSALDKERFESAVYPEWFLGSEGKKVTLVAAAPEDFVLLYPDYPTKFRYVMPTNGIDVVGDFSVMYDMRHVEQKDYYKKNPYAAHNYTGQPWVGIENKLLDNGKEILLIHDSFANNVMSFLAMGFKQIEAIDLRYFTGSVRNYIEASKPDAVVVLYSAMCIGGKIDWNTHTGFFDFR